MLFNFNDNYESPFEPGNPVSPENFVGRIESITKILRYAKSASNGKMQHFFLTGNKGMGKTSLAEFVKDYIENNLGMTGVYISNKDNNTVEGLINLICEAMHYKSSKNNITDKIKSVFDYIDSLEYKNAKLNFNNTNNIKLSNDLYSNFHLYLKDFIDDINPEKGIFLVIDDINGLSDSENFVNWYKRLSDTVAVERLNLKLYVLFAGYPEKFDNLINVEPSFSRIFHYEEIGALDDEEVKKFFKDTFQKVNIQCEDEVLKLFTFFSSGLPLVMQNIGDYAFWSAENNEISEDVAIESIISAGNEIGNKQLKNILKQIKTDLYKQILLKLGQYHLFSFSKTDFLDKLDNNEKLVFDDFLEYMLDLGILISYDSENNEIYEFTNQLYYTYFMIKSLEN